MIKSSAILRCGLDIGSTTIKIVLLEGDSIIYQQYRRHNADIAGELQQAFQELSDSFPGVSARVSVTGSGGLSVSRWLDLPFVQEVIAETAAIRRYNPETDVIIELGGEDAKITYLHPVPEQRMNGTCAGGTGAFIDQMASLLQTDAAGLNALAADYRSVYPIASRCGVFAKSDLQPLINDGAAKEDLAASVLQAVVNQSIAGLACGRPIKGNVIFLGGPLHFMPELRNAFERTLAESVDSFTTPDNAQLYVAIGAALLADADTVFFSDVCSKLESASWTDDDIVRIRPLFQNKEEKQEFTARHEESMVELMDISQTSGPCFLGIDAGSTTTKAVLINDQREIVFTYYASNHGTPVDSALNILKTLYAQLPATAWIARSCVTGYGEALIKAALHIDEGEIETMAHYYSAARFCPDVSFIIDIGGQDMKCMRVRDGVLDSIMINEACSSGCGSFISTFASSLAMDAHTFSLEALAAENPVDLGTRCTVFMNSRVKQAQKEGATVGEISAGLSYSVVRNALYKVIKLKNPDEMGEHVVVQGGTFLNDAILRCFELVSGRKVIRPSIAGLMGAFGAALIARERAHQRIGSKEVDHNREAVDLDRKAENSTEHNPLTFGRSAILSPAELADFSMDSTTRACKLCSNQCKLTVASFGDGSTFISGNRCERGAGQEKPEERLPNLFDSSYRRLFSYKPLPLKEAPRGTIGLPRVLNIYENYPLWVAFFTKLGYRVVLSGRSDHNMFLKGMDTIPSESVCYPAKLAHGHVVDLIDKGARKIFYPDIIHEQKHFEAANNHFNCPIVTSYPEVIRTNVDQLRELEIEYLNPFLNLANPRKMASMLAKTLAADGVTEKMCREALTLGFAEQEQYLADVRQMGAEAVAYLKETGQKGIVLAGRPYHLDPEVHHGVPEMINSLGLAVLTIASVSGHGLLERPIRVVDQWVYHSALYEAAAFVKTQDELELVQLTSFGCGLDAVTSDQVQEILEAGGKTYTLLKIDEISNLGAARIRLRSLKASMIARSHNKKVRPQHTYTLQRKIFTPEMRTSHNILAPQMAPYQFRLLEKVLQRHGYNAKVLEKVTPEDIETGLKFVNNDACYPTIIVVGQLINALLSGDYDPDNTSLFITQTGGGCRATNYVAFLRKALFDAGFPQVPVVALSASNIEANPGVKYTPLMLHHVVQSLIVGDMLQTVLLRVRPYEAEPGSATELYNKWDEISRSFFANDGDVPELGRRLRYPELVKLIAADFDALPLRPIPRKPRVGLTGEILVKFHPDANNDAVRVIESEGCEAHLSGLLDFFLYSFSNVRWNSENIGATKSNPLFSIALVRLLEWYRRPVMRALGQTKGKFPLPEPIEHTAARAEKVLSRGNACGEGWYLTGEMLDMIEHGVPNIICAQPFACLPNHVTGKGMIKELRRLYPQANIVAIDYDPGASEVNQLNRIKLMVASAFDNHEAGKPAPQQEQMLKFDHEAGMQNPQLKQLSKSDHSYYNRGSKKSSAAAQRSKE
ncbi:MAG: 2-hydroxyacyl-CoA dehydratase [Ruminococcaceae bacterium]|nr:2-hydroxyacyl-CoA dehydratase [Oscillospiraceae bacterium]